MHILTSFARAQPTCVFPSVNCQLLSYLPSRHLTNLCIIDECRMLDVQACAGARAPWHPKTPCTRWRAGGRGWMRTTVCLSPRTPAETGLSMVRAEGWAMATHSRPWSPAAASAGSPRPMARSRATTTGVSVCVGGGVGLGGGGWGCVGGGSSGIANGMVTSDHYAGERVCVSLFVVVCMRGERGQRQGGAAMGEGGAVGALQHAAQLACDTVTVLHTPDELSVGLHKRRFLLGRPSASPHVPSSPKLATYTSPTRRPPF